jgi:S-DNA-T family DNA segregation ATPase FtsK/SpoIIIE
MSARTLQRKFHPRSTLEEVENPALHAVGGLLLLGAALFAILAQLSYDPADLPAWCHLSTSDTASPYSHNLIGRLGAMAAGYTFWVFGAANYLIPACLTWFGVTKLASHNSLTARAWLGFVLVVICGSAILYLQPFWVWRDKAISPLGAGGGVGYVLGGMLLVNVFGDVGSLLLLGMAYTVGLIFVTGLHPVAVLIQGKSAAVRAFREWWMLRQIRREQAEALITVPPTDEPAPVPKRKRATKVDEISAPLLPLDFTPKPKIFDASTPKPQTSKPQLAEVWKKRNAEKKERVAFAPPASLTARFKDYVIPPFDILHYPDASACKPADEGALREMQETIIETLATFDIKVTAGDITRGPAITRYEIYPSKGLRVTRIATMEPDLARATKAERINILAPIPGKDTVGIELPNRDKIVVPIRELLEDDHFQQGKAKLPLALGKDVYGKTIVADLAAMPHLLVAGATGSGKSVCINSIVTSLLYRFAPDELRFIMIDPKVVEMQAYKDLPHLALPVVTDPKQALRALSWVVNEMEKRYTMFAEVGCRNFDAFNARKKINDDAIDKRIAEKNAAAANFVVDFSGKGNTQQLSANKAQKSPSIDYKLAVSDEEEDEIPEGVGGFWAGDSEAPPPIELKMEIPDSMPYIVVIVDELADLMQTAPADIEVAICRIAQKARAAGIHLILATQTPRADVVTGIIKANIPCRIAFQVSSALDSRVIMDRKGADKLVGKGDMLYLPPGTSQLIRAQGTMVTDEELQDLIDHCCRQGKPIFEAKMEDEMDIDDELGGDASVSAEDEAILEKVLEVIRAEKRASTSLIQRRLKLGYTRAARMMDILEMRGIIGPGEGAKPREILVELE